MVYLRVERVDSKKMSIKGFTNKVDGICNDYINFIYDDKKFRDNILDLLLELLHETKSTDTKYIKRLIEDIECARSFLFPGRRIYRADIDACVTELNDIISRLQKDVW